MNPVKCRPSTASITPLTLERYREVSLLPTRLTDGKCIEVPPASTLQGLALNERIDQLLSEEMARSLNAFDRFLEAIERRRIR